MDANSQRLRQEPDKKQTGKVPSHAAFAKIECLLCYISQHRRPSNRRHLPVIVPILPVRGQPSASPRIRLEAH
jgi:hypothetical protein